MIPVTDLVSIAWTPLDWEIGVGVTIPSTWKEFRDGVKRRVPFGLAFYIGPLTIDIRRYSKIIAFKCSACEFIHTGSPAWMGPIPGLMTCEGCHVKACAGDSPMVIDMHGEGCDGDCGASRDGVE